MRPARKILISLTLGCALFGAALVGGLFTRALGLPADAGALLARVNVSELAPGHFMLVDGNYERRGFLNQSERDGFLILRKHDGDFRVFWLMRREHAVGLPDSHWWRVFYYCQQFGPAAQPGVYDPGALIRCHDPDPQGWMLPRWSWSLDGKSTVDLAYVPDMERVEFSREPGGWLVLGKPQR